MSTPSGNSWEPEPLEPGAAPSPYAPAGAPAPTAPGYAALYPASGGEPRPPTPGYQALYQDPAYGYPPPGAMPLRPFHATGPMPPNHLVLAIVALFLFWIPGLVAVVYATQVESRWRAGDTVGARQASENARRWGRGTVVLSIALVGAGLVMGVAMSLLAA